MSDRGGGDTRHKILEVAEREFALEGFAGAHLQQIAEQVGVQKTAVYYYFPSKAALYGAVLTRILEDFERTVAEATESRGTHRERLERLLDAMNDLLAERIWYARLLLRVFVDPVRLEDGHIDSLIQAVVGRFLLFYREGVDAGALRRVSSRHVLQTVLGTTLFHYASGPFGAAVLDVEDLFTRPAVGWRRDEVKKHLLEGLLASPEESD